MAVSRRGLGWRYWASARKKRIGRGQKATTGANWCKIQDERKSKEERKKKTIRMEWLHPKIYYI